MSNDIFVITEHMDGKFSDVSFEMVGKAKELASALGGQAVAVVVGGGVSSNVFASDSTIHVDDAASESVQSRSVWQSHRSVGQGEIAASGDVRLDSNRHGFSRMAFGATWRAVRGVCERSSARTDDDLPGLWRQDDARMLRPKATWQLRRVLAGSFPVEAGQGSTAATQDGFTCFAGWIENKIRRSRSNPQAAMWTLPRRTKLVSIGRGIGSKDNMELAEELARKTWGNGFLFTSRLWMRAGCRARVRLVNRT